MRCDAPQLLSGGDLPAADLEALTKKRKMLQLKWVLHGAVPGSPVPEHVQHACMLAFAQQGCRKTYVTPCSAACDSQGVCDMRLLVQQRPLALRRVGTRVLMGGAEWVQLTALPSRSSQRTSLPRLASPTLPLSPTPTHSHVRSSWKTFSLSKGPKFALQRKRQATELTAEMIAK
jgi:hypothetical protein